MAHTPLLPRVARTYKAWLFVGWKESSVGVWAGADRLGRRLGEGFKDRQGSDVTSLPARWRPSLPMEVYLAPHPRPPHSLHTGSIFGERHQVGAVCRGQPETFSACFGDAAGSGRGGAVLRAAGKTFYGQDPENLPCYPRLGSALQ